MSHARPRHVWSQAPKGGAQSEPPVAPATSVAPVHVSEAASAVTPTILAAERVPLPAGSASPAPLQTRSPLSGSAPVCVSLSRTTSPPRQYASAVVAPGGPYLRLTDSSGRLVAPDRRLSVSGGSQSYILLPIVTLAAQPSQPDAPLPPNAAAAADAALGPVVTFSEYGSSGASAGVPRRPCSLTSGSAAAVLPAIPPCPNAQEGAFAHHGLASLAVARRISELGAAGHRQPLAGAPGPLAFGAGKTAMQQHMSVTAATSDSAAIQVLFRTTS